MPPEAIPKFLSECPVSELPGTPPKSDRNISSPREKYFKDTFALGETEGQGN